MSEFGSPPHEVVWARQIVAKLRNEGFPVDQLLIKAGIREEKLDAIDGKIPFLHISKLFEGASEITGDDCFGLHFAQTREPRDGGLISYLGLSSPNLLESIRIQARYRQLWTNAMDLDISRLESEGRIAWSYLSPSSVKLQQHLEWDAALFFQTYRMLTNRRLAPVALKFFHQRKSGVSEFNAYFGCDVEFGALKNEVYLKISDLHLPLITADDNLLNILRDYADEVIKKHSEPIPTIVERVERSAVELLARGEAKQPKVASMLGMSSRTLARRMAATGETFASVIERLRSDLAQAYLRESDLGMAEIAFLLGYSEVSSFNHAFRRWTGSSPGRFRESYRTSA